MDIGSILIGLAVVAVVVVYILQPILLREGQAVTAEDRRLSQLKADRDRTINMVKELDYCGLYSGRKVDKAALFENFYGVLKTAPMIQACPLNIECRVVQTIERPVHTVFIGEVAEVYFDEECLTDGVPDVSKIDPILFSREQGRTEISGGYWRVGEYLAPAWKVGKALKP